MAEAAVNVMRRQLDALRTQEGQQRRAEADRWRAEMHRFQAENDGLRGVIEACMSDPVDDYAGLQLKEYDGEKQEFSEFAEKKDDLNLFCAHFRKGLHLARR